ncbi:peptide deformylase [Streptomyces xylophagus]|uniref:peptide deformylase n=1 Tax=Streptomyces xylophagus TaxID=285514 RepID=UPI0005BBCDCE|nr:peptide deformylase [Streptomyces xylophagus]
MPRVFVQGSPVDSYPRPAPEAGRGSVRRVTEVGEEVLHRPSRDVTEFGPDLAALIDDMFLTMYIADGAGLAANQVGVDLRLFVYDCLDDDGVRHVGHIVNPVLDPLDPAGRRLLDEGEDLDRLSKRDRKEARRQVADRGDEVSPRRAARTKALTA